MMLDHGDRHDVEDTPGVRVLEIRQFLVASSLVVGGLNLAVHLPAISALAVDAVVPVGGDRTANGRAGDFLLRDLLDVERLLVSDVEPGLDLRDHVLNGHFLRGRARALLPRARFEFDRSTAALYALSLIH